MFRILLAAVALGATLMSSGCVECCYACAICLGGGGTPNTGRTTVSITQPQGRAASSEAAAVLRHVVEDSAQRY